MKNMLLWKQFIILLLFFSAGCKAIIVTPTASYSAVFVNYLQLADKPPNIIGEIASLDLNANISGKIVIHDSNAGVVGDEATRFYQSLNVKAVILSTLTDFETPGLAFSGRNTPDSKDISIPVYQMYFSAYQDLYNLLKNSSSPFDVEISWDDNTWESVFASPGVIVMQIVVAGFAAANVALGIWKLSEFVKSQGFSLNVAQFILILDIVGNLERAIITAVDPGGVRQLLPNTVQSVLGTFSIPLLCISALLLTLFWHEILFLNSIRVVSFVTKLKIPFFVISAVVMAFEVISQGARIGLGTALFFANQVSFILYLIIILLVFLYYLITSILALKRLSKSSGANNAQVQKLANRVIMGSIGLLATEIGLIFVLLGIGVFQEPVKLISGIAVLFTGMNLTSLAHILAFSAAKNKGATSKSTQMSSRMSTNE